MKIYSIPQNQTFQPRFAQNPLKLAKQVNDLSAKFRQTSDPELRKAVVMLRDFHQRLNSNQNSEKKQFISTVEQVYNKIEGKSGSFQSLLASYKDHKLDNAQPEIVYESKSTDRAKLNVR